MTTFEKRLFDAAVAPYVQAGKFATHFARGKLTGDPVFREILQQGLIGSNAHLIDIGCGQGLLSAWIWAAESMAKDPYWPKDWSAAPLGVTVRGIELMEKDVLRASKAMAVHADRLTFDAIDMCDASFEKADVFAILDVLHYVPFTAQKDILHRVHQALLPGGLLILRVGDAAGGLGFKVSNWVDNTVTFIRGHRLSRLYCRTLSDWIQLLINLGFAVETKPMSQGTPFANVLLLARIPL